MIVVTVSWDIIIADFVLMFLAYYLTFKRKKEKILNVLCFSVFCDGDHASHTHTHESFKAGPHDIKIKG